jgi:hypothetical protein
MEIRRRWLQVPNQNVVGKKGVERTCQVAGVPGWQCVKNDLLSHGMDACVRTASGMNPDRSVKKTPQSRLDRSLNSTKGWLDLESREGGAIVFDSGAITNGGRGGHGSQAIDRFPLVNEATPLASVRDRVIDRMYGMR